MFRSAKSAGHVFINRFQGRFPLSDRQDFEDCTGGLIVVDSGVEVKNGKGKIIWDQTAYDFFVK